MSTEIIRMENVSKLYRLGEISSGTLSHDARNWWNRVIKKNNAENDSQAGHAHIWSLRNVTFSLNRGEVLGVVGRNGAGKSTLLKLLSRITKPTEGIIKLDGRVSSLLEVGTGFHPELSGRENIYLNGAILGMRKHEIKSRFDEIVEFSGIGKFIDTPVKRYSSGMFVRLAFAVAAHLEPEILIIDEVLAVGDQQFQQKCIGKMQDVVSNTGRTILFVSHNNTAIKALCTKCLLLEQGRVKMMDTTQRVLEAYQLSGADMENGTRNGAFQNDTGFFTQWQFNDASHQPAGQFSVYTRNRARLSASFTACAPIRNCEFHFLILDEDDNHVLHGNSKDFLGATFTVDQGSLLLSFEFHFPVRPGKYKVQLGFIGNGELLDHWRTTTTVQVLDTFDRYNTNLQGILNVKTDFRFQQLETVAYPTAS
jgi:lipopolysaccharide transport system ATP-binding protein